MSANLAKKVCWYLIVDFLYFKNSLCNLFFFKLTNAVSFDCFTCIALSLYRRLILIFVEIAGKQLGLIFCLWLQGWITVFAKLLNRHFFSVLFDFLFTSAFYLFGETIVDLFIDSSPSLVLGPSDCLINANLGFHYCAEENSHIRL